MMDGCVDLLEQEMIAIKIVQLQTARLEMGAPKLEGLINQYVFTEYGKEKGRGSVNGLSGEGERSTPKKGETSWRSQALSSF